MITQIAIDGPVAAGKGAVAQALSKRLNILNIDTGAMYRVATYLAMTHGLDVRDEDSIVRLLAETKLELREPTEGEKDGRWNTVLVDGKDVSDEIRRREIGMNVAKVAALPKVRKALVVLQKKLAEGKSVVMEGRDIGTVVLPKATLKIYLDARLEVRARRRWEERKLKGEVLEYDEIYDQVRERDEMDLTRQESPLVRLSEAMYIDSSDLSVMEVVDTIVKELGKLSKV
jgi:cytidylate kinase